MVALLTFQLVKWYYIYRRCAPSNLNTKYGGYLAELKIAEVILRERRRLNLTQEELAIALMVSPQAVSNWERGGYPDITLLPRIANFFKISVDELIGNDEVNRQADIEAFIEKFNHSDVE